MRLLRHEGQEWPDAKRSLQKGATEVGIFFFPF